MSILRRILAFTLLGWSWTCVAQSSPSRRVLTCPKDAEPQQSQAFDNFKVVSYWNGTEGCLEVQRNGELVYSRHRTGKLTIGNSVYPNDDDPHIFHAPVIPIGTDITGLGKPDVIVNEWSGGAHCCFTFHVLELDTPVREVAKIEADDSDYAHFEDLEHDGKYEFVGWDFTFAYWHAGFGQSPAPKVILRSEKGHYGFAPDLMQKPLLTKDEFNRKVSSVKGGEWVDGYPPPEMWGNMLDLIYSGNSDLAWKFASAAWVQGKMSERKFLRKFCGQLALSRYFLRLRPTIKSAPCEFDPKNAEGLM